MPTDYVPEASWKTADGALELWHSDALSDDLWDAFLRSSAQGQFQQSSLWARYKRVEGWSVRRVVLTHDRIPVGGFQILWRRSRLGRVGYASKGPVIWPEDDATTERTTRALVQAAQRLKLVALLAQPPDESRRTSRALLDAHFVLDRLQGVNTATLLIDLRPGSEALDRAMRRRTLQEVRQAKRRGVRIQEADEGAIPVFFELMAATCHRQQTAPQPASVEALRQIWRAFAPRGYVRLTLAVIDGTPVAGQLTLGFGERATLWKKGWTEASGAAHPVTLLTHESLQWAHARGYAWIDFAALAPDLAVTLLAGRELSETQRRSRHMFNLGFGAVPRLLPEAMIFFPNPVMRWAYAAANRLGLVRTFVRRFGA